MTRDEFLGRLGELLACLPAEQVEETKAFYAEAIADRMEDGMSEEEAVAAMGTPGEVAEATLDDLPAVPRAIARTRRRSTALLWVLTIVGSPVWVPLLAAFAAVAVTVYICIWVLALCVWIVAAALGGVGVVGLLLAVSGVTIGHFPYALASAGVGLGLVGVALFVGAGAWAASKQIARLSALWARRPPRPSGRVRARGRRCRVSRGVERSEYHDQREEDLPRRGGGRCRGRCPRGHWLYRFGFRPGRVHNPNRHARQHHRTRRRRCGRIREYPVHQPARQSGRDRHLDVADPAAS
ncbi:MAG: DUF1700 domain-containing protein [Collinsella sp.]